MNFMLDDAAKPSQSFSIRPATRGDAAAIRKVLECVRREHNVHSGCAMEDPDLDDIPSNYFGRGGSFVVVQNEAGRVVGCAGLLPLTEHRAELCKMYLEKDARGCGLGKRLLANMLAAARRGGFVEVWLETNSSLADAIALYTRNGFVPVGTDGLLPKCDRAYLLRLNAT